MHRIRVYVDTSILGGVYDEEFAAASRWFFEEAKRGKYRILLSSITYDELEEAPTKVLEVLRQLPEDALEEISVNEEVRGLAEAYISAGALGRAAEYDALHVAAATIAEAEVILSWNFRHIVNYSRIRKFNAVNLMSGYRTLDIRSPLEMEYDDEEKDL